MDVVIAADCGNAPKKLLVRDWLIDAAAGDVEGVEARLDQAAHWEDVGAAECRGRSDVAAALVALPGAEVTTFGLHRLLSHGKHVAVDGTFECADGRVARFAHFIEFSGHGKNAGIESVVSYVLRSC